MANPVDPDFRARLAALNQKFAASVPSTIEKMTQALADVEAASTGGQTPLVALLQPLHELLHGVAGSAATFGFPTFGREARRIEHMVRGVMSGGGGWEPVPAEVRKLLAWAGRDAGATDFD